MRVGAYQLLVVLFIASGAAQEPQTDQPIDEAIRMSVIERLLSRVETDYVIPEAAQIAIRTVRTAHASGDYKDAGTAKRFAERLTSDLRSATHDKHIAVFFDPAPAAPPDSPARPVKSRERFNFGFNKIERLRGNVGYLDLRSFANLDEGRETASSYLDALANFDAIIIDLRQNGGGNTPMAAYIASYFFGPKPVHFTDMYWRDQNKTVEVWTSENVPGRRSVDQDLFLLVGPSTFSAAEDFLLFTPTVETGNSRRGKDRWRRSHGARASATLATIYGIHSRGAVSQSRDEDQLGECRSGAGDQGRGGEGADRGPFGCSSQAC